MKVGLNVGSELRQPQWPAALLQTFIQGDLVEHEIHTRAGKLIAAQEHRMYCLQR